MTDRTFYVRFPVPGASAYKNCNSGTRITIPEDMNFIQARNYIIEEITRHLNGRGAANILRAMGFQETNEDGSHRFVFESCNRFHWLCENALPGEADTMLAENEALWAEENAAKLKGSMVRLFESRWEESKKTLCEGAEMIHPAHDLAEDRLEQANKNLTDHVAREVAETVRNTLKEIPNDSRLDTDL
jgi:hypothetical protein